MAYLTPFFVKNFQQIHGKCSKSLFLKGWVHKFGSIVPNATIFYGFPIIRLNLPYGGKATCCIRDRQQRSPASSQPETN